MDLLAGETRIIGFRPDQDDDRQHRRPTRETEERRLDQANECWVARGREADDGDPGLRRRNAENLLGPEGCSERPPPSMSLAGPVLGAPRSLRKAEGSIPTSLRRMASPSSRSFTRHPDMAHQTPIEPRIFHQVCLRSGRRCLDMGRSLAHRTWSMMAVRWRRHTGRPLSRGVRFRRRRPIDVPDPAQSPRIVAPLNRDWWYLGPISDDDLLPPPDDLTGFERVTLRTPTSGCPGTASTRAPSSCYPSTQTHSLPRVVRGRRVSWSLTAS